MGDQRMYLWTPVKGVCPFQTVTTITGSLDNNNHPFTSHMILGAFNLSRGLIRLPTECSTEQANLVRTKYTKLFVYLGEHTPLLQKLERDIDMEMQVEPLSGCRR